MPLHIDAKVVCPRTEGDIRQLDRVGEAKRLFGLCANRNGYKQSDDGYQYPLHESSVAVEVRNLFGLARRYTFNQKEPATVRCASPWLALNHVVVSPQNRSFRPN